MESKELHNLINQLRAEGRDYRNFPVLIEAIKDAGVKVGRDELLSFIETDNRLQVHTTPNQLAQLVVFMVSGKNHSSAIDLCCGTGNILYFLQNSIDDLTGVELNENVASLTRYGMPDLRVITADTFYYTFNRKYDLVVGNVPWGQKVSFEGTHMRIEQAFIRKAMQVVADEGEVIMIVPYNVLQSGDGRVFREDFSRYVKTIIGLPSGIMRFSQVKTAIVRLSKTRTEKVELGLVESKNDFGKPYHEYIQQTISLDDLGNKWSPEQHLRVDEPLYKELEGMTTKRLSDLAEIVKGINVKRDELTETGEFLYLKPIHIKENGIDASKAKAYVSASQLKESWFGRIVQPGDIILSTIFNDLKLYVYQEGDPKAVVSNNLVIIRSANDDYIQTYLQTEDGRKVFGAQASDLRTGVTIPYITLSSLSEIQIPIIPISDLNKLGNRSISNASASELEELRTLVSEQQSEISNLKDRNSELQKPQLFLDDRLKRIEDQLLLTNQKLDNLSEQIKGLSDDFARIRNLPRDEEEKLIQLYQKLDQKLEVVLKQEVKNIANYVEQIKRWLDLWEHLDEESQRFLPVAEFIFDELCHLDGADYSPFILQYSRAFENELLKKLFIAYHSEGLQDVDIKALTKSDMDSQDSKAQKFANMVLRNKRTYTLGDMNFIMSLLKSDGNTLKASPLLQHFKSFSIEYFNGRIFEKQFLGSLRKITEEFRNKAAHPNVIGLEKAKEFQALLRSSLNTFLESLKLNLDKEG